MQRFLDIYWVVYFIGYVLAVAVLLWLYQDGLKEDTRIYLLAAIFGVAAGASSTFAIIVEVGGRIVLLIPAAVKKIKEEGRKEGHQEGRQAERAEWEAWLKRRDEAEANNLPFDEPPPSQRK